MIQEDPRAGFTECGRYTEVPSLMPPRPVAQAPQAQPQSQPLPSSPSTHLSPLSITSLSPVKLHDEADTSIAYASNPHTPRQPRRSQEWSVCPSTPSLDSSYYFAVLLLTIHRYMGNWGDFGTYPAPTPIYDLSNIHSPSADYSNNHTQAPKHKKE